MAGPTIAICSSANFYEQVNEISDRLAEKGFSVVVPLTANIMRENGDYDVSHYRTWLSDDSKYDRKTYLMKHHFAKVAESDAILVVNNEKHGVPNYVGGNVLMEMALAMHLDKPIFLLNEIPTQSNFLEEIIGLGPIVLHGELSRLAEYFNNDLAPA
ncbi:MAG: hypothetical protein ACHQUB_02550 [Candidatus Saccharimonadia bacterium]